MRCKRCSLIDAMVAQTKIGSAPNLVYDDNGRWAVSEDGMMSISIKPADATITVFVRKSWWSKDPYNAIEKYLKRYRRAGRE